jgi:hypothetical protein
MKQTNKSIVEVLDPAEQLAVSSVIQQATNLTGLSSWERHKIEWRVRRQRGELIVQLAEVETQTVFAEAVVTAQGRIEQAKERAAVATFKERLRCLVESGHIRDDALAATSQLAEDSREIVAGAVERVASSYMTGVERRAQGVE